LIKRLTTNLSYIFFILFSIFFILSVFSANIDPKLRDQMYYELSKENLYQAEKIIYDVLKEDPFNTDALFAKSILILSYAQKQKDKALQKNMYLSSLKILDNLEKKLSGFYYFYFVKGKVLENLNRFDDALRYYDNCIYYNKKFVDAYISKSQIYWRMGDINKSFETLKYVEDKYLVQMLLAWYNYQLGNYDQALSYIQKILDNNFSFKNLLEKRNVLNELYFQVMWIRYRMGVDNSYWISQNKKYNTNDYYFSIALVLDKNDDEQMVRQAIYSISKYPDKPYAYFVVYKVLKKYSNNNNRNYLEFLKKAVELDVYNLDFRRTLEKERK